MGEKRRAIEKKNEDPDLIRQWKIDTFMKNSNFSKPEEDSFEEKEEGQYETGEMFSDTMFENRSSTNVQNKYALITNDSSSDTSSEESGNTYVSSIISDF